jgi:hypothetical protein
MLTEVEREVQVYRFSQFLTDADRRVWSKPGFPEHHRPDVPSLSHGIRIGTGIESHFEPHPGLKPEVLEMFRTNLQELRESSNSAAFYDILTRQLTFNPILAFGPDDHARRFAYHEAASDISNRMVLISPEEFTSWERARAEAILREGFADGNRPTLDELHIARSGFLRYLMMGDYLLSSLLPADIHYADEAYPTIHEIVTDQIIRRGGDVEYFDSDAKSGKVRIVGRESHLRFSSMLFRVMTMVDWRDLLDAYKTGELKEAAVLINDRTGEDIGSGIIIELFNAMKEDEETIEDVNRGLGVSFTRPEDIPTL